MVRVFTKVPARRATEDELHAFKNESDMASLKGGEIDEKTILKFPTVEKMKTSKGKKEGDITVFREGITSLTQDWFPKPTCGRTASGSTSEK